MDNIILDMPVQRCPKCNKILSPQESVCANCGTKLNNHDIGRINSIYHFSNVATLIYIAILFIGALLYGFVNWIVAIVVVVLLFSAVLYLKFKR